MTSVHVDLRKPTALGRVAVDGSLTVSLYRRQFDSTFLTLVTSYTVPLVNGQATLNLTPTPAYNAWVINERVRDGKLRIVGVPDSSTTLEYTSLVDLDPATLAPAADVAMSSWAAVAAQAVAARDAAIAARNTMVVSGTLDSATGVITFVRQDGSTVTVGTTVTQASGDTRYAQRSNNLSDLANVSTARTNLGLVPILAAKADLVGGLIPTSQLPAIALANTQVVASQSAMLALTSSQVQPGDLAVRTDGAGTFILVGTDPSVLANWQRLNAPTDVVVSVNGQQGTVVLGKTDVGLGNVDNTSDVNKPVSTAAQSALNLKAPLASPTFTGTVSGITAAMVGLGNVNNTSDANKPVSTAQQSALDAKAPLASPALTGTPTVPTAATADNSTTIANTAFVKAQGYLTSAPAAQDATSSAKGVIQLAGDLTGTAAAPALVTTGVTAGSYGSGSNVPVFTVDAKGRITTITTQPASTGFSNPMTTIGDLIYGGSAGAAARLAATTDTVRRFLRTVGTGSAAQAPVWDTLAVADVSGAAPLASPALTGTPTAPTASQGTNTTQLATTAFVTTAVGAVSTLTVPNTQTASYTLVLSDSGKAVETNVASANTVTVPPNSSVAFPIGTVIEVGQIGAGQTTIAAGSGVTIRSSASLVLRAQYSTVSLRKRATDEWVLAGDVV